MSDMMQEQGIPTMPAELGQTMAFDQAADSNRSSLGSLARLAAVGFSSALAFFSPELIDMVDSSRVAQALGATSCNITSQNLNTIACGPHGPVAKQCLRDSMYALDGVSNQYIDGTNQRDGVVIKPQDMHGCNPAGVRWLFITEKLRKGPSGTFQKDGNTVGVATNYNKPKKVILNAPFDCATDGAGSAIEIQVSTRWKASKSYKVPGHPKLTSTRTYDAHTVC